MCNPRHLGRLSAAVIASASSTRGDEEWAPLLFLNRVTQPSPRPSFMLSPSLPDFEIYLGLAPWLSQAAHITSVQFPPSNAEPGVLGVLL